MSSPTSFAHFFKRDLQKLETEIGLFPNDDLLWATTAGVSNSAGTLGLHLAGNLQHFIGAYIGGTGYVRDRPREFSARDLSRQEIIGELRRATDTVEAVLGQLSEEDMAKVFPGDHHFGKDGRVDQGLLHLLAHLNYHLGQVNYLRRVLTGATQGLG